MAGHNSRPLALPLSTLLPSIRSSLAAAPHPAVAAKIMLPLPPLLLPDPGFSKAASLCPAPCCQHQNLGGARAPSCLPMHCQWSGPYLVQIRVKLVCISWEDCSQVFHIFLRGANKEGRQATALICHLFGSCCTCPPSCQGTLPTWHASCAGSFLKIIPYLQEPVCAF